MVRASTGKRKRQIYRRVGWALVVVCCVAVDAILAVSGYVAARLTALPREALAGSPADFGLTYENVSFPAREDNTTLAGWYILPQATPRDCTILMVHGRLAHRNDQSIKMLDLANDLARDGYGVLMIDLRAHGESEGDRLSLGYYERRDVLGAVDYLAQRPDTSGCVAGFGFSMGAATLISAAAEEPRIRALVADSSFAEIRVLLDAQLPAESGLPAFFTPPTLFMAWALYGMDLDTVRPVDLIDDLAPRPVLLIHGTADSGIAPEHARRLYEAANNRQAELWLAQGSQHVRAYVDHPQEYRERLLRFLDRSLSSE
jgi:uncharacterized protein